MFARLLVLVVATVVALEVVAAPARASLGGEVAAGKRLSAQVQGGQVNCRGLSDDRFEQLGEYVMDRMLGSRAAHAAMNERMSRAVGVENTDRMHELMGRSFAGCVDRGASSVPMGPGMMGGGGWGAMMGARFTAADDDGWSAAAVLGVVLGAALVGALLVVVLVRRPWRRRSPDAPSAA